ncbi:hypothetical protein OROGR_003138 [Orobanche gracilis]
MMEADPLKIEDKVFLENRRMAGTYLTNRTSETEMDLSRSKMEAEMDVITLNKKTKKQQKEEVPKEKNAVLIGLKHPHMKSDVKRQLLRMKDFLVQLRGFSETNITLMIDDDQDEEEEEATYNRLRPTDMNIRLKLCSLVDFAVPGDILYIHLIAYGCADGFIFTADGEHLPDSYLRSVIWVAARHGCNLTFVSDCLIDSAHLDCPCPPPPPPKVEEKIDWNDIFELNRDDSGPSTVAYMSLDPTGLAPVDILSLEEDKKKKTHEGSSSGVILLTPFIPINGEPKSHDISELLCRPPPSATSHDTFYGGFTNAVLDVIEENHGQLTNLELAQKLMDKLGGQKPSLRFSNLNHACGSSFVC